MPITIPLAGSPAWPCRTNGAIQLNKIDALSLSLDSWGGDPFAVWLDGLCVE
jgi:hypothetical protein